MKRTITVFCLVSMVATILFVNTPAFAGSRRWFWYSTSGQVNVILEVPAGKKFILGSVVVNNSNSIQLGTGGIFINQDTLLNITLPPTGHFEHVFKNVILGPGDELRLQNLSTTEVYFTVTGLLKKK